MLSEKELDTVYSYLSLIYEDLTEKEKSDWIELLKIIDPKITEKDDYTDSNPTGL